jgi:kynureninase
MDITSPQYAAELDRQDELASFRDRFAIDDPNLIYLDGNSLGRMPKAAFGQLQEAAGKEWGSGLVRGWHEWIHLPTRLGAKIAQIIGVDEDEVICTDSTSVDLYKLVMAALDYQTGRTEIVTDDLNFPSDLYVMQSCMRRSSLGTKSHGRAADEGPEGGGFPNLKVIPSKDGIHPDIPAIKSAIGKNTALTSITHVAFKSGFMHDMKDMTAAAHSQGALALWDLSHSVGAVPLNLKDANADLAVGCTYKYLNGGPGSPAFLYVRRDLQEKLLSPIWGWFGERKPFDFRLDYEPAKGISRFFAGTPPIISMAAVEPGVDLILEAGMDRLRKKSLAQTEYLIQLYDQLLAPLGVALKTPRDATHRGSHVSFGHPEGLKIDLALIEEENVIPDFRAPDNIRFGCCPLYTTFNDLREGVVRMSNVIKTKSYERFGSQELAVT